MRTSRMTRTEATRTLPSGFSGWVSSLMAAFQDWTPARAKGKDGEAPKGPQKPGKGVPGKGDKTSRPVRRPRFPVGYLLFLGMALMMFNLFSPRSAAGLMDYSVFKQKIRQGEIRRMEIQPDAILGFNRA